ncbi:MAG: hypothetical protein N2505_03930 [Endomicrobia bacterium]|nr:hypothetical protein [Endomicrobiia bacterium]MDW8056425.1 hypothetical protein [Elusimicrobiota bacterium]
MSSYFRYIKFSVIVFSFLQVLSFAQEVYICVWRNPERTMQKIFPQAKDYKTIIKKISNEKRQQIEKRLGAQLLPGQREQYQYYEITDSSANTIGYIIASSQKGEYGAIEFVFGIDKEMKIVGIYIQRAREKDKEFKKKEFLDQFIGKSINDEKDLDKLITVKKTTATSAVILGVRKEFICFDELVVKQN